MKNFITILQIVLSVALVVLILIQARGTGLGRGSSSSFTRRGVEKLVFRLTFVVAILFIAVSVFQIL